MGTSLYLPKTFSFVIIGMYSYIKGQIMIITFCGHSNYASNSKDANRLLKLIEKVAKTEQVDFYFGGYGNFDAFALKCAKTYKLSHPNAKLIFITPYLDKWLDTRKDFIKTRYDEIIYPELERTPQRLSILKRNEWMVDKSDYLFCYVRNHYGGAYKTLLYAHKQKKLYTNLYEGNYELY